MNAHREQQVVSILELVLADMEKAYKAVEDKDIDLTTPSERDHPTRAAPDPP